MSSGKNQVTYAYRWNSRRKRPGQILSESEACERFESGEEFTVVVPAEDGKAWPTLVTFSWKSRHVITSFLDKNGRKDMEYTYYQEDDDWLFLYMRNFWHYPNDDPGLGISNSTKTEEAYQKKDGYTRRIIIDEENNTKETMEYRGVPVEGNWEPVPEFGSWESISRHDR